MPALITVDDMLSKYCLADTSCAKQKHGFTWL